MLLTDNQTKLAKKPTRAKNNLLGKGNKICDVSHFIFYAKAVLVVREDEVVLVDLNHLLHQEGISVGLQYDYIYRSARNI